MKLMIVPAAMIEKGQMEVFDDFVSYIDAQLWTKTVGAGAAAAILANTPGGILSLTTGGTQNITANIALTNATFKLAKGRNWYAEALLQYTEAATNQAALCFGLSSVTDATLLTSTTGVPVSSFSGNLIYKQTGDTLWRTVASNGSTQTLTTASQSSQPASTTDYQALRIEGRDVDGSNYEVTYFLNDQPLLDNNAGQHRPIKHTVAIASISASKLVVMLKNVGGANSETLLVDYVAGFQRRPSPTNT
jgi:hypothetical protein